MSLPLPDYGYLLGLIDDTGIFEHSRYGVPRREHGYTVDDASRGLVILCDAPDVAPIRAATRTLLAFTLDSLTPEGWFRNRLSFDRQWAHEPRTDDTQGRAIWALCVAATKAHRPELREAAVSALAEIPPLETEHVRPLAYAALGAAALRGPDSDALALRLARPIVDRLRAMSGLWPEPRLRYANGRIPAAMLAAGSVCNDSDLVERGLQTLSWLVTAESLDGHFSFTPVGGWSPGDSRPGFDQQPIEAAAMSDACERAWVITGEDHWKQSVLRCGAWLLGANDSGVPLYDPSSGATADGLMRDGANGNRGAESTISGLEVLQACSRVVTEPTAHRHPRGEMQHQR
ncbi:MAG TPA: glycosyltransferase [Acidimicrobiia bacterium]